MINLKWLRNNKEEFIKAMESRNLTIDINEIIRLESEVRNNEDLVNNLRHAKNEKAKQISKITPKFGKEFDQLKKDAEHINTKIDELLSNSDSKTKLQYILDHIPNIPSSSTPIGNSEKMNIVLKNHGIPKEIKNPKSHFEIGEALGMMDFERTAQMSGSRYVSLSGVLSKLERAITSLMLDTHINENGFTEISPPYIVKDEAMYNIGLLPKFSDESFITKNNHRLIPTGEVPLTNLVANKIIPREALPLKYVCYSPCFRSEAGSAGRDTRGMIRLHQFSKVELVVISAADESEKMHQLILESAESILQKLELPYQVVELCTGDLGFTSTKTYDLEVWVPSENTYREISSCSNCGDFQARRMNARYRELKSTESIYLHSLNGSGLAVGRTLLAILENYQNEDGSVTVPKILRKYMDGLEVIKPIENITFF
jgi:seryl-tRNA synthetase